MDAMSLWLHVVVILLSTYHIRLSLQHAALCSLHIKELTNAIQHLAVSRREFHMHITEARASLDARIESLMFALDRIFNILVEHFPNFGNTPPHVKIATG